MKTPKEKEGKGRLTGTGKTIAKKQGELVLTG